MIELKTYQLLSLCYVQQDAKDFERIYCETVDGAKMVAAWWIYENSNVPYQLKWEVRGNSHWAMIPHRDEHKYADVGFTIRGDEIKVGTIESKTYPGILTPAWIDATHQYDYGNIEIRCPTCDNSDKGIVALTCQTSPDYFTHIVSQVNTKCSKCGARWELYRDGTQTISMR